jgi:hypothetical protein
MQICPVLQESCINTLLLKGADRNKLVLEIPLYGLIYEVRDPEEGLGFHKESEGLGKLGPFIELAGYSGYNEVSFCSCDGISSRENLNVRHPRCV